MENEAQEVLDYKPRSPRPSYNLDITDIAGTQPKSNIRGIGKNKHKTPSYAQRNQIKNYLANGGGPYKPGELQQKALRNASVGYNLINNQPDAASVRSSRQSVRTANQDAVSTRSGKVDAVSARSGGKVSSMSTKHIKHNSLNIEDIIGNTRRNQYGQTFQRDSVFNKDSKFAGMRRGAEDLLSESGGMRPPQKNASLAFAHLDMSQSAYMSFLQKAEASTRQMDKLVIAGVATQKEPTAMQNSLIHRAKEIRDARPAKVEKAIPMNPTQIGRIPSAHSQRSSIFKQPQVQLRNPTLRDGYVRLFAAELKENDNDPNAIKGAGKRMNIPASKEQSDKKE